MKEIINNDIMNDNKAEQNALADIDIGLSNSPIMNDVKNMTEQELSEDHMDDGELKEEELDIVDLSVNYKNLSNEDDIIEDSKETSQENNEDNIKENTQEDLDVGEQYVIDGEIVDNSGIVGPKFKDIDEVMQEFESDTDSIMALAQKYMKNKEVSQDNISKLYRHLLSKGFDYDEVNSVVREIKEKLCQF